MQVEGNHNIIVPGFFDPLFLGDDKRGRTIGDNSQGAPSGEELHAFQAVGPHDDQIGILFNGNIVDVFKNGPDADGGLDRVGVIPIEPLHQDFYAKPSIRHLLFRGDDVKQEDFTLECFSDDKSVFQRDLTHRSEVHGDEDAMLRHGNC